MKAFTYLQPNGLPEAISALDQFGPDAKVIAGGQALLLALKSRLARPNYLVSLRKLPELAGWRYAENGTLEIGPATTYAALEGASLSGWHSEVSRIAGNLADRPVRNMGTIGGAACQAEPRYDVPVLLVGVDAAMTLASKRGERIVAASEFFDRRRGATLAPTELLTKVTLAPLSAFSAVAFEKFRVRVFDAAIVSVLCAIKVNDAGMVTASRIAIGAVERVPMLAQNAAAQLIGGKASDELPAGFAQSLASEVMPDSTLTTRHRRYQAELIKSLVGRAWARASASSQGAAIR